ncbi:MAG: hypothetical protein KA941_09815, partial [Flavobacteriales bacterium]|nr:hypothetical protein [Flavobacteriales bacterium]
MRLQGHSKKGSWPLLWLLPLAMLLVTCAPDEPNSVKEEAPALPALPPTPGFDQDSAYAFVQKQVDFGPRVPGTPGHK